MIPRTALAEVLTAMRELADDAGVRVANVLYAGDGNLHPLVLFDDGPPPVRPSAPRRSAGASSTCA